MFSISIIIPAYNVENYIEDCLNSIKNQTIPPDEVIVIDDGSTDSTFQKVQKFEGLKNLKLYQNLNSSQGASRELGKYLSKSEFIYFLDSDDYISKEFIETIKNLITQNQNLDLILFQGKSFTDEKNLLINSNFNKGKKLKEYCRPLYGVFMDPNEYIYKSLKTHTFWSQPCLFVSRKSIWTENRISIPSHKHEDEAVLLELFIFSKKIVSIPNKLFFRRYRNDSDIATCKLSLGNLDGYLQCSLRTLSLIKSKRLDTKFQYINARLRLSIIFKIYLEICYELKEIPSLSILITVICNVRNFFWISKILIRFLQNIFPIMFKKIFSI